MSNFSKQEFLQKLVLNAVHFSGANLFCRHWTRGLGSILMLHHVVAENSAPFSPNSHLSITPKFLDEMLTSLAAENYDFVSMDEVIKRMEQAGETSSNKPFIAVTLDDGYRDNLENAVPIFRKHNMPYTIFVTPGFVDATADLWWEDLEHIIASAETVFLDLDGERKEFNTATVELKYQVFAELMDYLTSVVDEKRQRGIVKDLAVQHGIDVDAHRRQQFMTWGEITELNKDPLCTIGAHTISHPMLARLSIEEAKSEMMESAGIIEAKLGERPKHFAYPYGMPKAAGPREFHLAKECGFASAVTTRHGVVHQEHKGHLTALPRISLNGSFQSQKYVKALISGIPTLLQNKGKRLNVS